MLFQIRDWCVYQCAEGDFVLPWGNIQAYHFNCLKTCCACPTFLTPRKLPWELFVQHSCFSYTKISECAAQHLFSFFMPLYLMMNNQKTNSYYTAVIYVCAELLHFHHITSHKQNKMCREKPVDPWVVPCICSFYLHYYKSPILCITDCTICCVFFLFHVTKWSLIYCH